DYEEAGAVITARQAIVGPADGELLFPRAHEGLARPFPAAIVVHGVDVIEASDQGASQHGLAATCGNVPPALGGPALVLLVADGNADAVSGIVAEAEIGPGGRAGPRECHERQRGTGEHAGDRPTRYGPAPNSSSRESVSHSGRTRACLTACIQISREVLSTVNEDCPEVIHVGQRRPRR